ncbi:MAG: hypothetical protein JWO08_4683 [Verrucomicrobiaceae bacterium]|nr:hypothetical protein [Verrucomicrobiaceae bacterium]
MTVLDATHRKIVGYWVVGDHQSYSVRLAFYPQGVCVSEEDVGERGVVTVWYAWTLERMPAGRLRMTVCSMNDDGVERLWVVLKIGDEEMTLGRDGSPVVFRRVEHWRPTGPGVRLRQEPCGGVTPGLG